MVQGKIHWFYLIKKVIFCLNLIETVRFYRNTEKFYCLKYFGFPLNIFILLFMSF